MVSVNVQFRVQVEVRIQKYNAFYKFKSNPQIITDEIGDAST